MHTQAVYYNKMIGGNKGQDTCPRKGWGGNNSFKAQGGDLLVTLFVGF